jgi:hypothetical protein
MAKPSPFTQPNVPLEITPVTRHVADFNLQSRSYRLVESSSRKLVDIAPLEPGSPCKDPAVYIILLPGIGEIYVGQTASLADRMKAHRSRRRPVKEALERAAAHYEATRDQQTGAELHRVTGYFRYLDYESFNQDGQGDSIRKPFPLGLQDLNDRLLLETATLRALRQQWPRVKLINAETGHSVS